MTATRMAVLTASFLLTTSVWATDERGLEARTLGDEASRAKDVLGRMVDRTDRELTDEDVAPIATTYHAWRCRAPVGAASAAHQPSRA